MGAGCPITPLLLRCPAALSHQPGTQWGSCGTGVTLGLSHLPALDWEPGNPQDTGEPAAQLQASALLGEHEPKAARPVRTTSDTKDPKSREGAGLPCKCLDPGLPAEEQSLGQPQVGAVLELPLQPAGARLVMVCKGGQGKRKVKRKTGLTLLWKQ